MVCWKRERGGGVISYRLFVDGERTNAFVMRKHGRSGPWVGRIGTVIIVEKRLLAESQAEFSPLLELYAAKKRLTEAAKLHRKAWLSGRGRQRAQNEVKWAKNAIADAQTKLDRMMNPGPVQLRLENKGDE